MFVWDTVGQSYWCDSLLFSHPLPHLNFVWTPCCFCYCLLWTVWGTQSCGPGHLPSLMDRAPVLGSQHAGVCSLARCQRWEAKKMPSSLTLCCVLCLGGASCLGKVLIGERECIFIRCVLRLPFTLDLSSLAAAVSNPGCSTSSSF